MRITEKDLVFNIIFTPGTVKFLRLFSLSLRKWSDCAFCIISNGCGAKEVQMLREICRMDPRFEFIPLPFKKTISHGAALTFLQQSETSPFFCFMDSDILVSGPFLTGVVENLDRENVIFSGLPVWQEKGRSVFLPGSDRMKGQFNRTLDHYILGGTYFTVYKKNILDEVTNSSGITFKRYTWDEIPDRHKLVLVKRGLRARRYDTGKVLNILINEAAGGLCCLDIETLHHIGGLSYHDNRFSWSVLRSGPYRKTMASVFKTGRLGKQAQVLSVQRQNKMAANRFFVLLFHALEKNKSLPQVPEFDSPEVARQVKALSKHVVYYYGKFKHMLL